MTKDDQRTPDQFDLIIASKSIDGPEFGQQTELIKSSGAGFDTYSKTWRLWLEHALIGDEPGLEILFRAARDYGTTVWLRRRQPSQGFVPPPE
ncbi:hypothetical protein ACTOB_001174 [Actinoplanes oblitus]|uniref:Uncharacterized protein n=1 Tax=Actinoplanes oblitus TaxID=3040509 RepID=A0ABY8WM68_9ACTN|nr:hypothetical protein [Actinoplanes oblitus]WIM97633.1 hypothetical protein ACTOB_001174 [Actinoplanes oblitus]